MDTAGYEVLAQAHQQKLQAIADLERSAERFWFRANSMLNGITEDMIMNDMRQTMCRSNIARACFEGAAYAKREAAALRASLSTE